MSKNPAAEKGYRECRAPPPPEEARRRLGPQAKRTGAWSAATRSLALAFLLVSNGAVGCTRSSKEAPASPPASSAAARPSVHWSYEGREGPTEWGHLHPAFAKCDSGDFQSPIDLSSADARVTMDDVRFDYAISKASAVDNGHTVQVQFDEGNAISLDGAAYRLVQLHFHSPSEHAVDHVRTAMEVHLVHENDRKDLAVVAVMVEEGQSEARLEPFFAHLPEEGASETVLTAIDPSWFLPQSKLHYRYYGSLTTPPCSEGVR